MNPLVKRRGADFSDCRTWRYRLWRKWNEELPSVVFLMLNPSTADEMTNDPTVERCERYAGRWGFGGMVVLNLFALRSTDPRELEKVDDPVGPENDAWIAGTCLGHWTAASPIICAWGNRGSYMNRATEVVSMIRNMDLRCLGLNKTGQPKHPLYLRSNITPKPFDVEAFL